MRLTRPHHDDGEQGRGPDGGSSRETRGSAGSRAQHPVPLGARASAGRARTQGAVGTRRALGSGLSAPMATRRYAQKMRPANPFDHELVPHRPRPVNVDESSIIPVDVVPGTTARAYPVIYRKVAGDAEGGAADGRGSRHGGASRGDGRHGETPARAPHGDGRPEAAAPAREGAPTPAAPATPAAVPGLDGTLSIPSSEILRRLRRPAPAPAQVPVPPTVPSVPAPAPAPAQTPAAPTAHAPSAPDRVVADPSPYAGASAMMPPVGDDDDEDGESPDDEDESDDGAGPADAAEAAGADDDGREPADAGVAPGDENDGGAQADGRAQDAAVSVGERIGGSAALISVCVMISRVTGFIRTWAMGFAMGTTLLSSSYQVACNLPNQLYELVMGGMLVTAFLPVYVSLRKREGQRRANEYASTLLGLVVIVLGAVALLATLFAPQVVYTQMFLNPSGDRELVTYFFRFFAIQLLFYGVSAVVGGLLNAERDYVWSSAAPIANNVVVIAVMFAYVFIGPRNPELGKLLVAVGTPVGVLTQMCIQIPPLARSGIRLRPHIDLHDPALRETLSLGVPTIVVTVASFVTVSVQNASAMAISDAGSSVLFYARQWFTLPYAFLSVPLTTTLFTELSDMAADDDVRGLRTAICGGTRQSLYFMIPFAFYLAVFSVPLVSLFCAGAFTQDSVRMVAGYLAWMAVSLPFYALFMFMQKVFSSLRRMRFYAIVNVVASVIQVVFTLALPLGVGAWQGVGINGIAMAQTLFFLVGDVCCYVYLRREIGDIGMASVARSAWSSLALGALGAVAGWLALAGLAALFGEIGSSIPRALAYTVVGGACALLVTYGGSLALHVPESSLVARVVGRLVPRR